MNIAVFVSGNGTNLQAIIDAIQSGYINSTIGLVLSDNKEAYALKRAIKSGIDTVFIDPKAYDSREDFDKAVIKHLKEKNIGLICLAGYMRLLSPYFIKEYESKIINIHPALLPSFKGMHGVRNALNYGVKITGPTVHFVTEEFDSGPIISQSVVEVMGDDTEESLTERVHEVEYKIYPEAIKDLVEGKLKLVGRKVLRKQ